MPAISFHTMKDQVRNGEKKQTIRPLRSDHWLKQEEGDRLVGYWKQRSEAEKLFDSEFSEDPYVTTPADWTEELAQLDGFDTLEDMLDWFKSKYGEKYRNKKFVVIRWK